MNLKLNIKKIWCKLRDYPFKVFNVDKLSI
jgi:hypothetical protein